jgi:hypothetical protein
MTFNSATANQACVDIASGGAQTQYVAIVLGYASVNHNLFVKVQDNNADGSFDRAYFEDGNNGADFATDVGLTPFAQARIHLALVGTDMTLDIDTNFDNHPDQSFTVSGVPTAGFGTAIGLGDYGHASADNFATAAIPPSPAPPGPTGQRAAALKSCKKRAQKHHWSHKRLKKCKKNANLLPI